MVPLLTLGRAGFIGRIAVLATGGLLTLGTPAPKTLCSQMTTPDYDAWDALVRAHVRPSQLRGIGVNVVDYQGKKVRSPQLLPTGQTEHAAFQCSPGVPLMSGKERGESSDVRFTELHQSLYPWGVGGTMCVGRTTTTRLY